MQKLQIREAIVVEGRDDIDAVQKACDAVIIATHGFGITSETWSVIEKAYDEKGIIILTDPDYSGEEIRRKLTQKFPDAKQAYVPRERAIKDDDIGVENASPEAIREAISMAKATVAEASCNITGRDITRLGLSGAEGSSQLRAGVCAELGIGYANARGMLKKLNGFGITLEELEQTVRKVEDGEKE